MSDVERKKVFISYSWDVQDKVITIVEELVSKNIDVVFDLYDLKPGDDIYQYMERSVDDSSVDYVLILSDRTYAEKANDRRSGVGKETLIIAPEVYENKGDGRFIPIVLEKDADGKPYVPRYLKGKFYVDLSSDDCYEDQFEVLVRHIYGAPSHRKPAFGKTPSYLTESKYDMSDIRDCIRRTKLNVSSLTVPKMVDVSIAVYQSILADTGTELDSFYSSLDQTKELRDLMLSFAAELIDHNSSPENFIVTLLEKLGDLRPVFRSQTQNDLISFVQNELLLSFVCLYLYTDDYAGLHSLLKRPFYTYIRYDVNRKDNYNFRYLEDNVPSLESYYNANGLANKLSAEADVIINRASSPIATKSRLISADLLLFHLYPLMFSDGNYWFPQTYIYQSRDMDLQLPWSKLESSDQYNRISVLFGNMPIDEFRQKMVYPYTFSMSYNGVLRSASWITDFIKPNHVGSKP